MNTEAVIVGPGRLGRTVSGALSRAGWSVQLIGRGERIPAGPLTWLTVPDRSIAAAAAATPPGGVVLHASGATTLAPLRPHRPAGSLHPLMTFPGPEIAVPTMVDLPAAVAGDPEALAAARELAGALGWRAFEVPGDRALYHAAAVLAGNYATTLLGVAAEVLAAAGVPADQAPALLAPLALTSLKNAASVGPAAALTGPAARGDTPVIERHRQALRRIDPELEEIYTVLLRATERLLRERDE
jgi:predicted short-subunit dehydrogenase-like oxidoreductase (DUF2520 family)